MARWTAVAHLADGVGFINLLADHSEVAAPPQRMLGLMRCCSEVAARYFSRE